MFEGEIGEEISTYISQALLYADRSEKYKSLVTETVGLVFLGTPFRGTKFSLIAESIAWFASRLGSHNGIIKELYFDNPALLDKLHGFCQVCNKLSMPVTCFFELYETDYGRRRALGLPIKGLVCMRPTYNSSSLHL